MGIWKRDTEIYSISSFKDEEGDEGEEIWLMDVIYETEQRNLLQLL
jgi:hypothetical protein